ncbi:MAG: 30S ribosome-binding factor RbfA [Oceanicaulis sp.]|uniref:30S ribosome-binding factor RbfA n=1 Tax=Glycocaulis sp. TaxID=1969725 RepID=UPI0025C5BD75|nr:30S ribosome-binding factor RbfA [Glycocaulis sp.]MCC5980765.1 30S ribosome-binding factor RbfA [Oceanicaulis sp.]MCH8521009.1 30S ribosome-binding factor RbfA [Glycocaulis sp.]
MKVQSQRQLRAGELVRRALADIIAEGAIHDPAMAGVPITVTEARMSPDLRHATVFVAAMGQADRAKLAKALDHAAGYLQRELARRIDLRFTPKLRFEADDRFDEAAHVDEVLSRPHVKRDLD